MHDGAPVVKLLVHFGRELRNEGLPIGSDEINNFCNAVAAVSYTHLTLPTILLV